MSKVPLIHPYGGAMNKILRSNMLSGLFILALSACATDKHDVPDTPDDKKITSILDQLNETTRDAVNAQRELAMTADAKVQRDQAARRRLLSDVVSYDFYGNVEELLRDIARKYGYEFEVYGARPPEMVNTNIFVQRRQVLDVLKQIGYTENTFLDIVVAKNVIELHYKKAK